MTSYLPLIWSVLPRSSPTVSAFPEEGAPAPGSLGGIDPATNARPTLVAFVRHCGCPFAAKEVKILGEATKKYDQLHVVIVQHSEDKETKEWFETIGGKQALPDLSRYTLVADPERKLYAQWGIGNLGWTQMVNGGIMNKVKELKEKEGIDLTPTGKGSWRWQNSGGFAIDREGMIRWRKLATDSSDMCDYLEAAKTVA